MKKALALVLACLLLASVCDAAELVTLKFNLVKSTSDPQYAWYGRFFESVEQATGGAIKAEIYVQESLGTTADVLEQASFGEPVVADCDLAYLADYVPDFAAVMSPYLIQTPEEGLYLWNTDIFTEMRNQLMDAGLYLLALNYEGTRNLITKTPIESRDDVAQYKIRCAATTMWNAVVEVLNGNPTNIPMSEVYQALSQGVADGCEGVYSVFYSQKWYESLKVVTKTEHLVGYTAIVMSSEVYNSLPAEVRAGLDRTAYAYMEEFLALSGGVQEDFMNQLIELGMAVNEIDKTEFIKAAAMVPEKFPDWTPGLYEKLVETLEAARNK